MRHLESGPRETSPLFDGMPVSLRRSGGIAQMHQVTEVGDTFVRKMTRFGNRPANPSEQSIEEPQREVLKELLGNFQTAVEEGRVASTYGDAVGLSDPMETQLTVGATRVTVYTDPSVSLPQEVSAVIQFLQKPPTA